MAKGKLTLIPTPIDEVHPLESVAKEILFEACGREESIFVIEDLKPGRRRWLRWGLPRQQVEQFELLNEHTVIAQTQYLLSQLQSGKNVYMMSDGGLPAFCDPGKELVAACHSQQIIVTATPFQNSVILALAMSGFAHNKFLFEGFLPVKSDERMASLKKITQYQQAVILMDTPYRMKNLLECLVDVAPSRKVFLAMDLNSPQELLKMGSAPQLLKNIQQFKREFILILAPI